MNFIIGGGGVGSWLTPSLCLLVGRELVTVIDGDKLEEKNLDRQFFTEEHIDQFKARVLSRLYGCRSICEWYSPGCMSLSFDSWLIVCADNNPARATALSDADEFGCSVIIAANEIHSAEAYYYHRSMKGGPYDPRTYYPELLTDHRGDPVRRGSGCVGEPQRENRQLVSANFMAAALAQHLYVLRAIEAPKMGEDMRGLLPYKFVANMSKLETFKSK